MKVILLAPLPPPAGGIAGWTQRMKDVKLKNNWSVEIVDEKVIGGRSVFGKDSKRNILAEGKRCIKIWASLIKELKINDTKVVQSCIPAGTTSMLREIVCGLITKIHKRKFIIHFRCTLPNMIQSKSAKIVFNILVKLSDCIFVLNTASADFVKHSHPKKRYAVIPNFIESDSMFQKDVFSPHISTLTYVGGVIPEKGCDLIVKIAEHFPDKKFRLIGKIGMDISLFPENVILLGEQPQSVVQRELDNTDVFLFLSRFSGEGFSNALAEAMSRSVPCIVSDWAANGDMIENRGGIVLRDYSLDEAIMAIDQLENEDVRRRCSKWNYNKVLNSYTDEIVTSKYIDVYEDLIR